ncbi:hypothetical protein ACOSOMT5_P2558 [Acidiphilium sp. MT5]
MGCFFGTTKSRRRNIMERPGHFIGVAFLRLNGILQRNYRLHKALFNALRIAAM